MSTLWFGGADGRKPISCLRTTDGKYARKYLNIEIATFGFDHRNGLSKVITAYFASIVLGEQTERENCFILTWSMTLNQFETCRQLPRQIKIFFFSLWWANPRLPHSNLLNLEQTKRLLGIQFGEFFGRVHINGICTLTLSEPV